MKKNVLSVVDTGQKLSPEMLEMLKGGTSGQSILKLAEAIADSKANAKARNKAKEAEAMRQLQSRIADMRTLADKARNTLLAEIHQELQGGTEVHLVRCYVRMPDLSGDDASGRETLRTTFRDHLSEPLLGQIHFTLKTERGSPWYGHLVATISVHA